MIKELQPVEYGYVGGGAGTELGALAGIVTLFTALATLKLEVIAPGNYFNEKVLSSNGWKVIVPNAKRAAAAAFGLMSKAFTLSVMVQLAVDAIVG